MKKTKALSRRNFLKVGVSTATLTTGASALASVCGVSASQVAGPFPPIEAMDKAAGEPNPGAKIKIADKDADLTVIGNSHRTANGQPLVLHGQVVDQNCKPVSDAVVHMWQADNKGFYNHHNDESTSSAAELDQNFQYSTILRTDSNGHFSLKTILPKYYNIGEGRVRTAHLHFLVRKNGYEPLTTQSYFEGDALEDIDRIRELNQSDIILAPKGKVRDELKPLIVHFHQNDNMDVPEGNLTINIQKL